MVKRQPGRHPFHWVGNEGSEGSEELGQGTRSRRHQRGVREDRSLEKDRGEAFLTPDNTVVI